MGAVGSRLAAFGLVLAGSFGTAYAVGEAMPGHSHTGTHSHGATLTTPVLPAAEYAGYRLVDDSPAGGGDLRYHLVGPDGKVVTRYTATHGAPIHIVVVRPDLSDFRHIHPDIASDGTWTVPAPGPGPWHLVVETEPTAAGKPVVVATDVDDGTAFAPLALPPPSDTVEVGDLTIFRSGLNFTVLGPDGLPATDLEPYLGGPAHLVLLHEGDLAYLHLHPVGDMTGMFMFSGSLPAGTSRLFLQFGYQGEVLTATFTVNGSS